MVLANLVVVDNLDVVLDDLVPEATKLSRSVASFAINGMQLHNHGATQLILCWTMDATEYTTWL
jgi:hypothetical protein